MNQGEAILERIKHRFDTHGNVIDALIEELTYLVLQGREDDEIEAEKVVGALRRSILDGD